MGLDTLIIRLTPSDSAGLTVLICDLVEPEGLIVVGRSFDVQVLSIDSPPGPLLSTPPCPLLPARTPPQRLQRSSERHPQAQRASRLARRQTSATPTPTQQQPRTTPPSQQPRKRSTKQQPGRTSTSRWRGSCSLTGGRRRRTGRDRRRRRRIATLDTRTRRWSGTRAGA